MQSKLLRWATQTWLCCVLTLTSVVAKECGGSSTSSTMRLGTVVDCTQGSGTYSGQPWVDAQQCPSSGFCCEELGQ